MAGRAEVIASSALRRRCSQPQPQQMYLCDVNRRKPPVIIPQLPQAVVECSVEQSVPQLISTVAVTGAAQGPTAAGGARDGVVALQRSNILFP